MSEKSVTKLPKVEFAFPGPLRDALVEAVRAGTKTASASLLAEYEQLDQPLPAVGDRGTVVDSADSPVCVIEITDVEVVPMEDVSDEHALAEGESYSTAEGWRAAHAEFWKSAEFREALGGNAVLDDSTLVVLERFAVVS